MKREKEKLYEILVYEYGFDGNILSKIIEGLNGELNVNVIADIYYDRIDKQ